MLKNMDACKPNNYKEWVWIKTICGNLGYSIGSLRKEAYVDYPYIVHNTIGGSRYVQGHTGCGLNLLSVSEFMKRSGYEPIKPVTHCQVHELR